MATLDFSAPIFPPPHQSHLQARLSSGLDHRSESFQRLQDPLGLPSIGSLVKDRPWWGPQGAEGTKEKNLMSHQGTPSGSHSSFPNDARLPRIDPPGIPTPQVSPTTHFSMIPGQYPQRSAAGPLSVGTPTPSSHVSRSSERSPSAERASRGLGVHALINPQQSEANASHHDRRRSSAHLESPSPVDSSSGISLPPVSRHSSREAGDEEWTIPTAGTGNSRRILSPRSPRLKGTRILGTPTGSIDAHQQPFLSTTNRPYTVEPGPANQAPGPPPPPTGTPGFRPSQGYFPSMAPTPPPQMVAAAAAGELRRPSGGGMIPSGSVSPSTTYSSMVQPGQSPASSYIRPAGATPIHTPGQTPPASHMGLAHGAHGGHAARGGPLGMSASPQSMDDRPMVGIPVVSSGQSNYQILTYETKHGQVTIPVDVQAASRVADEKRKRNAGASARFRARRKEKEREASATISKLEQDVRDATQDLEFYRQERDALAELLYNVPGGRSHFPRPQSPRHRRASTASSTHNAPSSTDSTTSNSGVQALGGGSMDQEDCAERSESDRNVRRRTSNYLPPTSDSTQLQASGTATPPNGAPSGGMMAMAQAQHPQNTEEYRMQSAPSTAQPSPQRPGTHHPFLERYDASWGAGGSHPKNGHEHR